MTDCLLLCCEYCRYVLDMQNVVKKKPNLFGRTQNVRCALGKTSAAGIVSFNMSVR